MHKFREVTLQDIVQDPNKYGAPTFEQFCKNPDAWRNPGDMLFRNADRGSEIFKNVRKHRYEIHGYKCDTLEEVERVCRNEGIKESDLEMKVEALDVGAGKLEMFVRFRRKSNVQK